MFGVDDIILGATVAGAATQLFGANKKRGEQKRLMESQLAEEELRRKQMEYDSLNAQRATIRNNQVTQALGLSNQTNAGAQYGSAAGGARGQAQGQFGTNMNKLWENLQIGEGIFNENETQARLKQNIGTDEGIMSIGSTISSLGKPLGHMFGGAPSAPNRTPADTSSGDPWNTTVEFA